MGSSVGYSEESKNGNINDSIDGISIRREK